MGVRSRDLLRVSVLGLALLPLRAWLTAAAGLDLHFDEAQYWEWSRRLDWSYYSKGPLVAWIIALSEAALGHGEWQVRLGAGLVHGLFLVLLYGLVYQVTRSRRSAWWGVILGLTTPLYFYSGLVMTTDVLLFAAWTAGLWAAYVALVEGSRGAWYALGAAVGIGALSKLSIGLLPFMLVLMVLLDPGLRRHLREPHLWGGLALMLLCMSPVLSWNANHDWVMFRHELGHTGLRAWSLRRAAEFAAGQWLALSPLMVLLALPCLWRRPTEKGRRLLWWLGVGGVGFFLLKSASGKVLVNWPAPVYIAWLVLVADAIPSWGRLRLRLTWLALASSALLVALALFPALSGLPYDRAPLDRMRAWRVPIGQVHAQAPSVSFLLTSTYTLAAELAFYWPQSIPVYVTGSPLRRHNQHDLWPGPDREAGRDALYVSYMARLPATLRKAFERCRALSPVPAAAPDGSVLRTLHIHYCQRYRPVPWPAPVGY